MTFFFFFSISAGSFEGERRSENGTRLYVFEFIPFHLRITSVSGKVIGAGYVLFRLCRGEAVAGSVSTPGQPLEVQREGKPPFVSALCMPAPVCTSVHLSRQQLWQVDAFPRQFVEEEPAAKQRVTH